MKRVPFLSLVTVAFGIGMGPGYGSLAHADLFGFKDVKGFESCMLADHLIEGKTTTGGKQERILSQLEVQQRCISSAVQLLKGSPSASIVEYIKVVKQQSGPEQSLPLIELASTKDAKICEESTVYSILKSALSHPQDYPSTHNSYFETVKRTAKNCFKDPDFKKDFAEEKYSSEAYLGPNACAILLSEKLVTSCPNK